MDDISKDSDASLLGRLIGDLRATLAIEDAARRGRAMEARFFMEGVVTWMACNSAMQNSDSVDEAFLYARRDGDEVGPWSGFNQNNLVSKYYAPEPALAQKSAKKAATKAGTKGPVKKPGTAKSAPKTRFEKNKTE